MVDALPGDTRYGIMSTDIPIRDKQRGLSCAAQLGLGDDVQTILWNFLTSNVEM